MPLGRDHFLLRHRYSVKEGLHRRFPEAPAPLMGPLLIVLAYPHIKVGLQLVDGTVELSAEGDTVQLVEHGLVEAFANAVGLWAFGLGARVIDVLDREIELILMALGVAAVLATAVGQQAQQLHVVAVE